MFVCLRTAGVYINPIRVLSNYGSHPAPIHYPWCIQIPQTSTFAIDGAKIDGGISATNLQRQLQRHECMTRLTKIFVTSTNDFWPRSPMMDIDAGDSPWGGKEALSTGPEHLKLTSKMFHRNQKPARQLEAATTFRRVRIPLLST